MFDFDLRYVLNFFSTYEFQSIIDSSDLKMAEEFGLINEVLENGQMTLNEYGHLVHEAVLADSKNWVAHIYASAYWRIQGQPSKAIECGRNAYKYSSDKLKYMSLLSMGNVLHRSQRSEDAAVLLKEAANTAEATVAAATVHFTLGNVHATLLDFNHSADAYTRAVKLSPGLETAKLRRHAVLCHQKIETALERQQIELQKTLRVRQLLVCYNILNETY